MDVQKSICTFIGTMILPGTSETTIQSSQSLFDDGIVDSLGLQQLVVHLETEYDVFIDVEHLIPENFETVTGISALVKSLVEQAE